MSGSEIGRGAYPAYDPMMRAIVLVGGEGTRLRPLTWRTPKALVPVLGRPLLEHLILHLKSHGVDHVTLAMTHRTEAIRDAFGDGETLGVALEYAYEDVPAGSGGAIAGIAQGWGSEFDETFLVVNGDVITDLDVTAMLAAHRANDAVLSISLHEVEDPSPFGVVDIEPNGRIRRFVEKPKREEAPSRLINAGTWIFEPRLASMMVTTFNRVEDHLFPDLCDANEPVYGFHQQAYWADVGNPVALRRVNLDMAIGAVTSPAVTTPPGGVFLADTASVEDGARLLAPAVIGTGCTIAAGATVSGSVLWDGVQVAADATIENSILATGVRVGAGARVVDSVVAHRAEIAAGASLEHTSIEPAGDPTSSSQGMATR